MDALLQLADGRRFRGRGFGSNVMAVGEVVFNTSMTGYQEIATDPSYHQQLVCLTQPLIGNTGVNDQDAENRTGRSWANGLIVREVASHYSNHRATNSLMAWCRQHGVSGIDGLDTRALTRHLRDHGAMAGVIAPADTPAANLDKQLADWGSMAGKSLIDDVTCDEPYKVAGVSGERFSLAAWDFGAKAGIFEQMARLGLTVHVFPADATPDQLLETEPAGIFLSNGPGDPAACQTQVDHVREVLGKVPVWGICLGHQLLARALGAETFKLPFGHHGGNHPVQDLTTGRIEITAQNHGFAVDETSLAEAGAVVTHLNLNDRSIEGLAMPRLAAASVQYHPEAGPGPHDSNYLFERFVRQLERGVR